MKDRLGHGSNAGTHSTGVQKVGLRYAVKLIPYSLAENEVGRELGTEHVVSTHRSLSAAGKRLASVIRSRSSLPAHLTKPGQSLKYLVHDSISGARYSRVGAKTGKPL